MKLSTPIKLVCFLIVIISVALGIHNAGLYNPTNGFDGSGHMYYVDYLAKNHQIPPPTEWETHQPPLYYLIAASIQSIFGTLKSTQYLNIIVFWLIIYISGLGLQKIFKNTTQTLIGVFSLVSLPMLNVFQPTITNELLNTFWIVSAGVASIFLLLAKEQDKFNRSFIFVLLTLVFGIWTKISIITILPTVFVTILLTTKNIWKKILYIAVVILVFALAYTPIYMRNASSKSPSNIVTTASNFKAVRSLDFFSRLDWITKLDTSNAQYYSFSGGGWNSFWTDGQNVITPFVPFHKKSFVLWLLGFALLPISLYGLFLQLKSNTKVALVVTTMGLSMLGFYLFYNIVNNHYSAVRLTYEMGIVFPYTFGLAAAVKNKKIFPITLILLVIQYVTLISFFWIQPWWFVTRDKFS